jgi:hypothetical protein
MREQTDFGSRYSETILIFGIKLIHYPKLACPLDWPLAAVEGNQATG